MTLEQLNSTLPNGLHDAQIRQIVQSFEDATVTFAVKILVGLPSEGEGDRSRYREANIQFHDVQIFIVECPDAESAFRESGSVWFTFSRSETASIPTEVNMKLAQDIQKYSFFMRDWFSSIHIAAREISFSWT